MATGTVKWFNPTKGYGFIEPEGGDKDVFVHISAVQAAGMTTLEPDQKIEYELEDGKDGKVSAGNLKAIFTSKELKEFDNRLKIFQMLMQGKKHREISENLNVGIATVTRGSLAFEKEEIFKMKTNIIDILRSKKFDNDK